MPTMHPKAVGDRTEARVLVALLDLYPTVLHPWGENQRYDFVVEDDTGTFSRVQVKTGRLREGAVRFNAYSSTHHHPSNQGTREYAHDYQGQADLFAVWCPETRAVYLLPVAEVGPTEVSLRVDPPKNNQVTGIRFATDYQVNSPE